MADWEASVLQILEDSRHKPLKIRDLERYLDVTDAQERAELKDVVHKMEAAGSLIRVHGKRFARPEDTDLIAGSISGHKDGYAFLEVLNASPDDKDLFIESDNLAGAMHGDRVVAKVIGHGRQGRLQAQVERITERAHTTVVGVYHSRRGGAYVVPDNRRLPNYIEVPRDQAAGAADGQSVVVKIAEYPTSNKAAVGNILEILGFAGTPDVDTEVILRKHGIPVEFPEDVLKEAASAAKRINEADTEDRMDLRSLPMVTIDGADAKDLDDAVSLEELENGNLRLGVHIADVSHYVRPGTALDDEAFDRGTSVYLEDRVVPMLPHELSNGICSLNAGEDRCAMSCFMELDDRLRIVAHEIGPSIIHVDHRMTYDAVHEILTEPQSSARQEYAAWTPRFEQMHELAKGLRALRYERGSLLFEIPEARAEIDDQGQVAEIITRPTNEAHHLIEEFMLVANETVARHVAKADAPFVYRVHDQPDESKLDRFLEIVASLGYRTTDRKKVRPKDLQSVVAQAMGKPDEHMVNFLLLRSLKQATYTQHNVGHFGLASDCYCHFTSPIRRYPDLMVHRILRQLAAEGADGVRQHWGSRLDVIAEHCSTTERRSVDAERESLRLMQLRYMADRVGDEFEARVTGVHKAGLFVETTEGLVDGLVSMRSLDDDYYRITEDQHSLEGDATGRTFRLGDLLYVQIVRVDIAERELDFRIVRMDETHPIDKRKKRKSAPKRGKNTNKRPFYKQRRRRR